MKLSYNEIADWQIFEDLVAAYFKAIPKDESNNITEVKVEPSGEGPDGGRDILVSFRIDDSVQSFERVWVIQCKFYDSSVSKTKLANCNIPTLIHEYKADGYLLVCKSGVTAGVSTMFENLNKNCKMDYDYDFWSGGQFLQKIMVSEDILAFYFPQYHQYLKRNSF
jgi:hypothetical protein